MQTLFGMAVVWICFVGICLALALFWQLAKAGERAFDWIGARLERRRLDRMLRHATPTFARLKTRSPVTQRA